jgi:RNA-directed DNA polymerase
MSDIVSTVAKMNSLTVGELRQIANRAHHTYRKYSIAKKKGGVRYILHPSSETKMVQYSVMRLLQRALVPHSAALGFVRGVQSPLKQNALLHAENSYFLKLDFQNFFPSIQPGDLFAAIEREGNPDRIELSPSERDFLEQSLFAENYGGGIGLPIGAPSSPFLSNGVMFEFDREADALAKRSEFVYSRYADDLVFSTAVKGASKQMLADVKKMVADRAYPKLKLNGSKTRFMSRNNRVAITGVIITPEGTLSVGRGNKRRIRSMLNDYKYEKITADDRKYLQGYLAFILDIEPEFYNRLCQKYGADTVKSALERP